MDSVIFMRVINIDDRENAKVNFFANIPSSIRGFARVTRYGNLRGAEAWLLGPEGATEIVKCNKKAQKRLFSDKLQVN